MKYYVYDLIDGRDGKTFYVGKGSGDRRYAHERAAMKGDPSKKSAHIRLVKSEGGKVHAVIVQRFEHEADAFAYEASRIAELGRENLLNIAAGGFGGRMSSPAHVALEKAVELLSAYQQWVSRGSVKAVSLGRHGVLNLEQIAASWLEQVARLSPKCGEARLSNLALERGIQLVWK